MYSPKIMHVQELHVASASWQLCGALCRALVLDQQDARIPFAVINLTKKNFFAVGFTNRGATTSFSAVKSINPYTPAKTVQRSLQNQGTYFYFLQSKTTGIFSFSHFYFHRYISLKIVQAKLFSKSDQGQARCYTQCLNRLHYHLAIFSFAN